MNKPIERLCNRLRLALAIRKMKQVELAEKTHLSRSAINQYISGYATPKNDRLYLIAKALDVSEAWLMGFDVPMERETTQDFMMNALTAEFLIKVQEDKDAMDFIAAYMKLNVENRQIVRKIVEGLTRNDD